MKTLRQLAVTLATLTFAVSSGCDDKSADTARPGGPTPVSQTVEYQLAVWNARGMVPEGDPAIPKFKAVLASLDPKYPEDAKKIGELSYDAQRTLEAAGVKESLLALMQNVNQAGGSHADYATAVKAYVAKRKPPGR